MVCRIIRVILHSDRQRMGRAEKKASGFHGHLQNSYSADLPSYHKRLHNILLAGLALNPDVLVLPACTIIHRSHEILDQLRRAAAVVPWVATGCLRIERAAPAEFKEFSQVWHFGKLVAEFDAEKPVKRTMRGDDVVIAQSSTIRKVYKDPQRSKYALALDLGHGQYSGRYKRTLEKLRSYGMRVVLSFWRNNNGHVGYGWYEGAGLRRIGGGKNGFGDTYDLLGVVGKAHA